MCVEPAHHDGDEPWYEDDLVPVAGRLFPPRFRISMRCEVTKVEMCIAVTVDRGGFAEPDNAISVTGMSSGAEKDRVRASARKLALPLALATMPLRTFRQTPRGWEWVATGWSPPAITKLADWANRDQLALLEELRRRTAPKWWSIYLPRIEKTAAIVWDAPAGWSTRRVIATLVCPATCVGRTQAYADLKTARELGLLP
ncbi:hypothetical protein ACH4UV_40635 [Streptomyces sp. NPDC020802]|uniref:hypothetical protein n=1 Tax=Streptomyces sp. NPDC020802 TaxID=3365094 RepID=UPI0037A8FF0F